MGQREVLEALEDEGWKTKSEIADILVDFNIAGINTCLKRLIRGNFVEAKKAPGLRHGYLYRIKKDDEDDE